MRCQTKVAIMYNKTRRNAEKIALDFCKNITSDTVSIMIQSM